MSFYVNLGYGAARHSPQFPSSVPLPGKVLSGGNRGIYSCHIPPPPPTWFCQIYFGRPFWLDKITLVCWQFKDNLLPKAHLKDAKKPLFEQKISYEKTATKTCKPRILGFLLVCHTTPPPLVDSSLESLHSPRTYDLGGILAAFVWVD